MSTEAARNACELQMLEGLVDCAYGLAKTLAAAAQAEPDTRHSLELIEGFTKCTFALRMGIRLCRTLRAPPNAMPARAEVPEREPAEHEPVERGERLELERERDRDYEPVSLPKFLSTLGVVARNAARLEDRLPPDAARILPTLQGLLAQAKSDPPSAETGPSRPTGVALLARPPQPATRHQLLGSAAPPRPGPLAPPRWPNSG